MLNHCTAGSDSSEAGPRSKREGAIIFFSPPPPPHYRFDDFEFRPDSYELFRIGEKQKLQHQSARLLRLLLDCHGRVVRREKILAALWGEDTFIDADSGINFTVRQLRIALGDSAAAPKYVETVPRLGYRFVIKPEMVTVESTRPATDVDEGLPVRQSRTTAWIGVGLTALIFSGAISGRLGPSPKTNRLAQPTAYGRRGRGPALRRWIGAVAGFAILRCSYSRGASTPYRPRVGR